MYLGYEKKNSMLLADNQAEASVCAVIVTYHPDRTGLENLICALRSQVSQVVMIGNGFGEAPDPAQHMEDEKVAYMGLPENIGLAAAQNLGIEWAKERDFSHILFLDQDSIPQKNMVRNLFNGLSYLEKSGRRPAAVGPVAADSRTSNEFPFVNFNIFSVKKNFCRSQARCQYVQADFLISSGMLVPLSVFEQAGMLDERLFIDSVDMEWCFRAQYQGFSLYGICDAKLIHCLGDEVIPLGGGKLFNIYRHRPLRQYYMMRNRILLYQRYYTPMNWRIQDFFRMIIKISFLMFFASDRTDHIRMILNGLWDGVRVKTGKYPH